MVAGGEGEKREKSNVEHNRKGPSGEMGGGAQNLLYEKCNVVPGTGDMFFSSSYHLS